MAGGSPKKVSDKDLIDLIEKHGPTIAAKMADIATKNVYRRRSHMEKKYGRSINGPDDRRSITAPRVEHPERITLSIKDGYVLVGSDPHYWPGIVTTAHRAFVKFCKQLKPVAVIMNGDVLDGSTISRHIPIGWENRPPLINEIEACKERLGEIVAAVPMRTRKIWPLGNHDARFETRLAHVAPEYAKVHGVHLKDHFSWEPCWSVFINDDVVVKHRFRGGIHAVYNNALWSGRTLVTGHLHSLKVYPISDYNGTRWGVDTGTMADPYGDQFRGYMEDNPRSWRSGFVVLSFVKGKLLWPQVVNVIDSKSVDYCNQLMRV